MMTATALVLLALAAGCFLARLVIGPSLADRSVGLDGFLACIASAIIVSAARFDDPVGIDTVLVVSVVGFVGTALIGRFIERRGS